MNVNDFDYVLPEELIAQHPMKERDMCRLLVLDRKTGKIEHKIFKDVLDYLNPGDCLVMNSSKVIPARIYGKKESTGANVEFLLVKRIEGDIWETMVRPGRRLKLGDVVSFKEDGSFKAEIVGYGEDGTRHAKFIYEGIFSEKLDEIGQMPLPPYIARPNEKEDKESYQTVYAKDEGSIACPTAGLHFTEDLLSKCKEKGVKLAYVTLHVGIGTFRPVKVDKVEDHHMHFEEYTVTKETADIVNDTIKAGNRIVCVGTTSGRTLESIAYYDEAEGKYLVEAKSGSTNIFMYPGYEFKIIKSLITNFHLPKSTLMMLVSAMYNREDMLKVYEIAVEEKYRFFSYGDAMIII